MTKLSGGDSKSTLYCSFCGKSQHEVRKLIAGPTVFICDECVELCNEILGEELGVTQRLSRAAVALEKAAAGEELFRDRHSEAVAELLAAARELRDALPKGERRT